VESLLAVCQSWRREELKLIEIRMKVVVE